MPYTEELTDQEICGLILKCYRLLLGLTQAAWAEQIGLSAYSLGKLEKGGTTWDKILKASSVIGWEQKTVLDIASEVRKKEIKSETDLRTFVMLRISEIRTKQNLK